LFWHLRIKSEIPSAAATGTIFGGTIH
jgi:hypothetical protein